MFLESLADLFLFTRLDENNVTTQEYLGKEYLGKIDAALRRNKANPTPPRNDSTWLEAVASAIKDGDEHAWGRAKLMVVGRGAAGKTSTVRSLLGQQHVCEHLSTEVADVHRTHAKHWQALDSDAGEFNQQVRKAAARRLRPVSNRFSLPRETLGNIRNSFSSMMRSTIAEDAPSIVEPLHVETKPLVTEKESAQRFELTEADQAILRAPKSKQSKDADVSFTIWDYGGQEVFYALHHIFLSDKGLYLVVFDMRDFLDSEAAKTSAVGFLKFWLNSIKLHAPGAPILLVGTYLDQVRDLDAVARVLRENVQVSNYSTIIPSNTGSHFFAVDNRSNDVNRAFVLREAIATHAMKQKYVRQRVPLAWLKVYEDLQECGREYVSYENVVERCRSYGRTRVEANEMLQYFHGLGVVVHLSSSQILSRVVVINPQWLVDKLARVISDDMHVQKLFVDPRLQQAGLYPSFERFRRDAIASRSLLDFLWDNEEVDYLLEFMDANMLLCPWGFSLDTASEDQYLVSGLLSDSIQEVDTSHFKIGLACELDFSEFYLPNGVFHRLVAQCVEHAARPDIVGNDEPVVPELDRNRALLSFGFNDFLVQVDGDVIRINIREDAERPAFVIKVLVSMFREQGETVFRGLPWQLFLVGPDSQVAVSYDKLKKLKKAGKSKKVRGRGNVAVDVNEFAPFFADDVGMLDSDTDGNRVPQAAVQPLKAGESNHVFLSHVQSTGGDLAGNLKLKLENRGLRVWFDQALQGKLNEKAMKQGISKSRAYVLVLTKGVFSSKAVLMEFKHALDLKKRVVLVHEPDTHRASYAPFGEYIETTPDFAKNLFNEEESLPIRRKYYEEESFLQQLISRCEG